MNETEAEILCERRGAVGHVTLNRPRALNALTPGMVRSLAAALDAWEHDPAIRAVVVTGAGDRAFCAGGDIRLLYDWGKEGRFAEALAFWREEYILNMRIKSYPKPYISFIDGIVMGGGVGVSLHGSHRVAGERYDFAMPEVGIGFFPDVGATHALPRLPGRTGAWLAVSGDRVKQADALALGLATHAMPGAAMPGAVEALAAGEEVGAVMERFGAAPQDEAPVLAHRAAIDQVFGASSMEDIVARAGAGAAAGDPFCVRMAASLATKSPTSMKIALEQMRVGGKLSFTGAMRLEYRIVSRLGRSADFFEGVRAVIVDKDQAPRWAPATLAEVSAEAVADHFQPVPDDLG